MWVFCCCSLLRPSTFGTKEFLIVSILFLVCVTTQLIHKNKHFRMYQLTLAFQSKSICFRINNVTFCISPQALHAHMQAPLNKGLCTLPCTCPACYHKYTIALFCHRLWLTFFLVLSAYSFSRMPANMLYQASCFCWLKKQRFFFSSTQWPFLCWMFPQLTNLPVSAPDLM